MKYGLSDSDWKWVESEIIQPLKLQGATVWIFGSRARGDHKRFSDVDLLFEAGKPLPRGFLSTLRERAEESRLPVQIDLVDVNDLAASFRDGVFRERREL